MHSPLGGNRQIFEQFGSLVCKASYLFPIQTLGFLIATLVISGGCYGDLKQSEVSVLLRIKLDFDQPACA